VVGQVVPLGILCTRTGDNGGQGVIKKENVARREKKQGTYRGRMFRNVGAGIRLLRDLRRLSAAELARRVGMSKSQLSKYETGRELPKLDSLERVLSALGSSALEFVQVIAVLDKIESGELSIIPYFESGGMLSQDLYSAFDQMVKSLFNLHRAAVQGQVMALKHSSSSEVEEEGGMEETTPLSRLP
jgi:transcriptional regulator with XRE-family HTH domain